MNTIKYDNSKFNTTNRSDRSDSDTLPQSTFSQKEYFSGNQETSLGHLKYEEDINKEKTGRRVGRFFIQEIPNKPQIYKGYREDLKSFEINPNDLSDTQFERLTQLFKDNRCEISFLSLDEVKNHDDPNVYFFKQGTNYVFVHAESLFKFQQITNRNNNYFKNPFTNKELSKDNIEKHFVLKEHFVEEFKLI